MCTVQMLGGGASIVVLSVLRGEHVVMGTLPASSWLAPAHLVVFGSMPADSAIVYAIQCAHTALASSYVYVNTVVAVGLGALFAHEHVTARPVTGMAVMLAGVALVMVDSAHKAF